MSDKMKNFRAQDMPGAKLVAFTESSKPKGDPETEEVTIPDENAVPQGTAKEVASWAGNDPDRIQRALEAEYDADEPRSTLIEELERTHRQVSGGAQEKPVQVQAGDQAQSQENTQA